mmetsp:Transcript_17207/g.57007  ORF Transcript_17207/g.57007 Transcript_17207/m.57007 type:complete len:221 (-) Transcript_17207:1261-1923(-)
MYMGTGGVLAHPSCATTLMASSASSATVCLQIAIRHSLQFSYQSRNFYIHLFTAFNYCLEVTLMWCEPDILWRFASGSMLGNKCISNLLVCLLHITLPLMHTLLIGSQHANQLFADIVFCLSCQTKLFLAIFKQVKSLSQVRFMTCYTPQICFTFLKHRTKSCIYHCFVDRTTIHSSLTMLRIHSTEFIHHKCAHSGPIIAMQFHEMPISFLKSGCGWQR